jgi:hypothetical protein
LSLGKRAKESSADRYPGTGKSATKREQLVYRFCTEMAWQVGCQQDEERLEPKMENISEADEADDLQVVDFVARPEGFEPPTLRSEERLRHRLTRAYVEKEVGNSSHKRRVGLAAQTSIPPQSLTVR